MKNDITLVELNSEHLEMVRNWRNLEEVNKYMYTTVQVTEEGQKKWFEKIKNDPSSRYWIIEYDSKPLGLASITNIDKLFDSCTWAFYLGDSSVRGAGIGSKVEYNIIQYVFETLKLNKLNCTVFTFNESVIKMHEGFGFRREALFRQHVLKDNVYLDVAGLALLKNEWATLKEYMYNKIYNR
jgi:UDP-4-amino-4,6-dideoxy-N-acetyl-beta-L-altrosamine N-acetyltransferase